MDSNEGVGDLSIGHSQTGSLTGLLKKRTQGSEEGSGKPPKSGNEPWRKWNDCQGYTPQPPLILILKFRYAYLW